MRKYRLNKKGVAILLVSILIVCALPITIIMLNLTSSQKAQSSHFNAKLNIEQTSLSGINYGHARIMGFRNAEEADTPGLRKDIQIPLDEDKKNNFDISFNKTGEGFFKQRIYMVLSKSKESQNNSIILADAELFDLESGNNLVITHDYWTTSQPYEIGVMADVLSLKNFRGKDQLRALNITSLELSSDYDAAIAKLEGDLPKDLRSCWDTVKESIKAEKIRNDNDYASVPPSTTSNNGLTKPGNVSEDQNTNNNDGVGWDEEDAGADTSDEIYEKYKNTPPPANGDDGSVINTMENNLSEK